MVGTTVKVAYNRIAGISGQAKALAAQAARETAAEIEQRAKADCPVASGALRAGIHTERIDELTYRVLTDHASTPYDEFVHNGTRRMAPRPFLSRAAEAVRASFASKVGDKLKGLG